MRSDPRRSRRNSGVQLPLWALAVLVALGVFLLAASSVWLFRTVSGLAASTASSGPEFNPVVPQETSADPRAPEVDQNSPVDQSAGAQPVDIPSWAGRERVNILLLGVDLRCDEEGPTHSDTIMVATIDPASQSAALLSLPRDLWVEIPGFGANRINQAYFLGQAYEYPGGGPQLAVETIEAFLGVPIDYYLTVDFQAFVEFVDMMGGIVVEVPETIDDPTYPDNCYGYDPFHIDAGTHRLDGHSALKFARTRATFGGDVDRAGRQQQVIMAVREQATQLDSLSQLLVRAPQLWQSVQNNVSTDMDLTEILQLARLAADIPRDRIRTSVLNYDYVYGDVTADGQQVLVPVREKIRALRDEIFAPPAVPTPVIQNQPEVVANENARVAIYNGTPTFGLAAETQSYLLGEDINVTEIGNADSSTYASTQIIDYGSHPGTVQRLVQLMNIPPLNVSNSSNPAGDYDVLVILGSDWNLP